MTDPGITERAKVILAANWRGASTVPSGGLYPHQWSWDAAYIALGWAHVDPRRAVQELCSLFRGQWADGKVPHIVFDPSVPEDAYFPGPAFWRTDRVARAPASVPTSGIIQPPLHARAALEIAHRAAGDETVLGALRELLPRLAAQHAYLAAQRDVRGHGLSAIVHPWESGLDNSPLWDAPLAAVKLPADGVEPYTRRDLEHADAADRPTDAQYDRYVFLASEYRRHDYTEADLRSRSPFLVEDPLFNAIHLWSAHALAELAELLGEDPAPHRAAAHRIHAGLVDHLWDAEAGRFQPWDVRGERWLRQHTLVSFAPLLDSDLPTAMVDAIVEDLTSAHFFPAGGATYGVPSYDRLAPDYDSRRYWRGPVWANTNWLLGRGLRGHGRDALADRLDAATLGLVERSGFQEHFDAESGEGAGSPDFSWTAALVLDLMAGAA